MANYETPVPVSMTQSLSSILQGIVVRILHALAIVTVTSIIVLLAVANPLLLNENSVPVYTHVSVWTTSIPASVASIVTVDEFSTLFVPIGSFAATTVTSTSLTERCCRQSNNNREREHGEP